MISYEPLWDTLKKKNLSQYFLLKQGLDKHTLQKLRHNESITMNTLESICRMVGCTPDMVVCFKDLP